MFVVFIEAVVAVGHLLAAIAVTVHVLLSHRDVRSAIGWIGLSWLSPFLGSFIYVFFGINRVTRRAARLREAPTHSRAAANHPIGADLKPNLVALAHAGGALVRHPLLAGNACTVLETGDRAYPEMLAAIAEAKHTIGVSFYIFDDDTIGRAFVAALGEAHQRGVEVRVLIDGVGGGYFRSGIYDALRDAGIPVRAFMHSWLIWRMSFLNLRNHKKLLLIDGRIGFTGGMNISDRHVGKDGPPAVRDVMMRLEGPVVRQMSESFINDWEFTSGERLSGTDWWQTPDEAGTTAMRALAGGPDEDIAIIEEHWASAIEQAEQRIRIVTPYFLPEDRMLDVLERAALRGVTIEIVIPEKTNHFYVDWAGRAHLSDLKLHRVNVYLTPEPFDHSKLMSIDGAWCCFGSPNWDARSMRLNFELMIECYDTALTGVIDAAIDARLKQARRLSAGDLARRSLPAKLRDSSARLFLPYL